MNRVTITVPSEPMGEVYSNLGELARDPKRNGRLYVDQNGTTYLFCLGSTAPTPLVMISRIDAPIILGIESIERSVAWPLVPALPGTTVTIEQAA